MSDEIHPNMDGHKLLAEEIARTIASKKGVAGRCRAARTGHSADAALLKEGKPVSVLAMPPFDTLIGQGECGIDRPEAKVNVTSWPTADAPLLRLEKDSQKVRGLRPDLVLIAVPAATAAETEEKFIRSYTWVMNWSLSFGTQEWDVIAVASRPSHSRI